jgi:hypothetical protein
MPCKWHKQEPQINDRAMSKWGTRWGKMNKGNLADERGKGSGNKC